MGGCKKFDVVFWRFLLLKGKRTRDFAFVSLCYGRSGEEMCTGYAMAASGRMQYDYKQNIRETLLSKITPSFSQFPKYCRGYLHWTKRLD